MMLGMLLRVWKLCCLVASMFRPWKPRDVRRQRMPGKGSELVRVEQGGGVAPRQREGQSSRTLLVADPTSGSIGCRNPNE